MAVDQAKIYHRQERQQFQSQLEPQLNEELELTLQDTPNSVSKRQQRRDNERQRIHKDFTDYRRWVQMSMTMEVDPFIKLVIVLLDDP